MMQRNSYPETTQQPLPLFRAQALAAQQHKFYGEILLIRPLSLALLFWLGITVSAVVVAFLVFGNYTEKIHVTGVLLQAENTGLQANLYVPARAVKFVRPGESIQVHCQSQTATGHVSEISNSVLSREEVAAQSKMMVQEPMYRISLSLPLVNPKALPQGAAVEAELRLGRRPLLQWLFER